MAGLCEGSNEPPGSLKANKEVNFTYRDVHVGRDNDRIQTLLSGPNSVRGPTVSRLVRPPIPAPASSPLPLQTRMSSTHHIRNNEDKHLQTKHNITETPKTHQV
ncbi:hypothetical protein ANN_18613 [Periplaneta americana]|uniref:Uncharacterized protein n=1 Tax=Periplaneta americana TaxID=6978 RepID=A0ABQ8SP91_PERAM|nr:hypothetical protein ANN_18613 [Periplaneta americana]